MHDSDPSFPLGTLLSSVCPVACNICQRESWQDALAAIRTSPIKNGDFDADTVTDSRGYVYDAPSYWRSGGNVVMVIKPFVVCQGVGFYGNYGSLLLFY